MLFENFNFKAIQDLPKLPFYHTIIWDDKAFYGQPSKHKYGHYVDTNKKGLSADKIRCVPCPVLKEYLIYIFYGRPAYRRFEEQLFPIVFIFSPEADLSPYKIFPFDSGAFVSGKYRVNNKKVYSGKLEDYKITYESSGIAIDALPKVISAIWESNWNYYNEIIPITKVINIFNSSSNEYEYLNFIYSGKNGKYGDSDSRAMTFEISVKDFLSFEKLQKVLISASIGEENFEYLYNIIKSWNEEIDVEILDGPPNFVYKQITEKCKIYTMIQ